MPEAHNIKDSAGVVVAVGSEMTNDRGIKFSTNIKVGDKIIHKNYGEHKYKHGRTDYRLILFPDVLAVLEDK